MEKSDIAQLRARLDAENDAGRLALAGIAYGIAQHRFISLKMERMGALAQQLIANLGEQEALPIVIEMMEAEQEREQQWNVNTQ